MPFRILRAVTTVLLATMMIMLVFVVGIITTSSTNINNAGSGRSSPWFVHAATDDVEYVLVGVSGGLQMGFPEHFRMDYNSGQQDEVQAVFVGRALVRGYRSYLDVMEDGWRQYTPSKRNRGGREDSDDHGPLINCNVIPTGCYNHANEYWIYLVDTRQFQTILFNEPRFLSIAPDHGLIDLTADETSPVVRHIAYHEISRQNKTDTEYVAFPIVTGVWFNPLSHVPSPVLYTKDDGTEVTNFPQSLATWAGVIDGNLPQDKLLSMKTDSGGESFNFLDAGRPSKLFFTSIAKRIREGEAERHHHAAISAEYSPSTYASKCTKKARFGVSPTMARVNYPMSPQYVVSMLEQGGYNIDFQSSIVKKSLSNKNDDENEL